MRYVGGTSDPVAAKEMVRDAMAGLKQFLERIDATELKLKYEHLYVVYLEQGVGIRNSNDVAVAFCAAECEQMRRSGLQEKTVADIGTRLSGWDRCAVVFERLADALDLLLELLDEPAGQLARSLMRDPVFIDRSAARTEAFSSFGCGVALIVNAIDRIENDSGLPLVESAAIASFGAYLAVESANRLTCAIAGDRTSTG